MSSASAFKSLDLTISDNQVPASLYDIFTRTFVWSQTVPGRYQDAIKVWSDEFAKKSAKKEILSTLDEAFAECPVTSSEIFLMRGQVYKFDDEIYRINSHLRPFGSTYDEPTAYAYSNPFGSKKHCRVWIFRVPIGVPVLNTALFADVDECEFVLPRTLTVNPRSELDSDEFKRRAEPFVDFEYLEELKLTIDLADLVIDKANETA